jgi:hypothetical protein
MRERSEHATSSKISDLISSQLAGVDSYLEAKKRQYGAPDRGSGFLPMEEEEEATE